jgi:phosphoribosylformylglycinamidine synthase
MAVTNCMNFASPERPQVMREFAESIRGMRDACLALETPVTGGNVSFYNESGDSAIWPTPVIGMLGLLPDYRLRVPTGFPRAGLAIYLLGETFAELGGSEFADVVLRTKGGRPPAIDLTRERALIDLLVAAGSQALLASAHDCGEGGLIVTLAEAAILGAHGFAVSLAGDLPPHVALFSESASRAVVSVAAENQDRFLQLVGEAGVPMSRLGETGGPRAMIDGVIEATVEDLRDVWESAIPRLLGEPVPAA